MEGFVPMDGRLNDVRVTWEGISTPIQLASTSFVRRSERDWVASEVISLPAALPDTVELTVRFRTDAQSLGNVRVAAHSIEGAGAEPKEVGVSEVSIAAEESLAAVKLQLSGLRTLLSASDEQRLFLSLDFESQQPRQILLVTIGTPPSRLTQLYQDSRNVILSEGVRSGSVLPLELRSQSEVLTLVNRVRYRNDSPYAVKLEPPFRIPGALRGKIRNHSSPQTEGRHARTVSHHAVVAETEKDLSTDLYVIPGVENIQERWTSFASAEMRAQRLEPGQEIEWGLYTSEAGLNRIGSLLQDPLHIVSLQTDALPVCGGGMFRKALPASENGDEGVGYCNRIGRSGGYNYSDQAIAVCRDAIRAAARCQASGWNPNECVQAALSDDALDVNRSPHPANGIPWPLWMTCARHETNTQNRLVYIHVGWDWVPQYSNFFNGDALLGVNAVAAEGFTLDAVIRYATQGADLNREGRGVQLFRGDLRL